MKEDELLLTHHVGDVINILQKTTHHLFDPDDLLTVKQFFTGFLSFHIFITILTFSLPVGVEKLRWLGNDIICIYINCRHVYMLPSSK